MIGRILLASFGAAVLLIGCSQGGDTQTGGSSGATSAANNGSAPTTQPTSGAATTGTATAGGTTTASTAAGGGASGTWGSVNAVLQKNCAMCHSGAKPKAGLDVTTYAGVMKGTREGPVAVAGKPDDSLIVKAIEGKPGAKKMPPKGNLSKPDIDSIRTWIQNGAKES